MANARRNLKMWDRHFDSHHDDVTWQELVTFILGLSFVVFWVIWAGQIKPNLKSCQTFEQEQKMQANAFELQEYGSKLCAKADKLGPRFGPKEYYAYLRLIHLEDKRLGHPFFRGLGSRWGASASIEHLLDLMEESGARDDRKYEMERWRESMRFETWKAKYCPQQPAFGSVSKALRRAGLSGVLLWLFEFYCRSVFVMFSLYCIRVIRREGFRALLPFLWKQKVRIVVTSVCWIAYFWRFPYNVLRELWVEALIRRGGELFRRLDKQERELVREAAESANYRQWVAQYHEAHASRYERSMSKALLVAVLINLLPVVAFASIVRKKAPPTTQPGYTQQLLYEHQILERDDGVQADSGKCAASIEAMVPRCLLPERDDILVGIVLIKAERPVDRPRKIDHVPDFQALVRVSRN